MKKIVIAWYYINRYEIISYDIDKYNNLSKNYKPTKTTNNKLQTIKYIFGNYRNLYITSHKDFQIFLEPHPEDLYYYYD